MRRRRRSEEGENHAVWDTYDGWRKREEEKLSRNYRFRSYHFIFFFSSLVVVNSKMITITF